MPGSIGSRSSAWVNLTIFLVSILLTLGFVEVGYRIFAGLPALKLANWRTEHVMMSALGELKATVDPVLGWTLRPWTYHEDGYTTIDHGVRKNFDERTIRTGAVLAVGDSFTEGWEVDDHESWPAFLEKLTKVPVVNAGIGGFGADQTILRAEQMLPIVKPKILILGFHEVAITRAGYSIYGAPKPYFELVNGELLYHPPDPIEPRQQGGLTASVVYGIRDMLGYSAAADYVLARLGRNFWYANGPEWTFRHAGVDEAAVTCALLRRLKARTDQDGIHLVLLTQYYATVVIGREWATHNVQRVMECAKAADIRVIDQLPALRAVELAQPNSMPEYYHMHNGELYGHMTAKGNEHAASLLAPALRDWLSSINPLSQTAATPNERIGRTDH